MPLPPPPPIAFTAVAAAAKIAVKEYLPTLTSASLAAWLVQWMWQRVPKWIKEDVVWSKRSNNSSEYTSRQEERLSTLWERHRALLSVAESLLQSPVPHLPAALLTYVQLSGQLRQQPECVQGRNEIYQQAGPEYFLEQQERQQQEQHFSRQPLAELAVLRRALDWAVWAYELNDQDALRQRLETGGFTLERCVRADRPGSVGYYVALSDDVLLIAIKGTSSLEDILTDTCGRSVPYQHVMGHTNGSTVAEASIEVRGKIDDEVVLASSAPMIADDGRDDGSPANNSAAEVHDESAHSNDASVEVISGHERVLFAGGDTTTIEDGVDQDDHQIQCHEGILLSAQTVAREVQAWVQKYVVQPDLDHETNTLSSSPSQPRRCLRLVGHSLGASVACFVAMILRSRFPSLAKVSYPSNDSSKASDKETGILSSPCSPLHVYAFAPPPVVDHDSALASTSYVTTVVNNADVIPRCSLINVALYLEILRSISERLEQERLVPAITPKKLAKFVQRIYGSDAGNAGSGSTTAAEPLLTVEQIWTALQKAREDFPLRRPDHLYVPGKVLLFYQNWEASNSDNVQTNAKESRNETDEQDTTNNNENCGAAGEVASSSSRYMCRVTDGTALALQTFEIDGFRWIGDHTTASYYRCLGQVTVTATQESCQ